MTTQEQEFLARLNKRGELIPEVLTDDDRLQAVIRAQAGLLWKAVNVRRHLGLD